MWKIFTRNYTKARFLRPSSLWATRRSAFRTSAASLTAATLLLSGPVFNDNSANSLAGVDVDSSIDPFPTTVTHAQNPFIASDHKLVASGVRSVTFLGFKVYGVGLYVASSDEHKIVATVQKYLNSVEGSTVDSLLNDKEVSQQVIDEISTQVPYAVRITPVRNTDFGHLRDGLTKSILASPMAKKTKEEVSNGVEQLRLVFSGFKGSVPKNHSLWVVSNTKDVSISYEGKKLPSELGVITEPIIARVLLVLYLSNAKPLSEPLRKDFVSYVKSKA